MNKNFQKSFDDLLQNHYGRAHEGCGDVSKRIEGLFANYYGQGKLGRKRTANRPSAVVLSLSRDDGEILPQPSAGRAGEDRTGQNTASRTEFEEYVVMGNTLSRQSSLEIEAEVLPASEANVFQEYRVDVLQPLAESNAPAPTTERNTPSPQTPFPPATRDKLETPTVPVPSPLPIEETSKAKATEEDFVADLQSILTGQKVFDPLTKKTVEKDRLGQSQTLSSPTGNSGQPASPSANEHAIFDRIAQSMQYANQYDVGTVELKNRFSDFDKVSDLQEKVGGEKKSQVVQPPPATAPTTPTVGSADFLQDLDAIQKQRSEVGTPSVAPAEPPPIGGGEASANITSAPSATAPPAPATPVQPAQP